MAKKKDPAWAEPDSGSVPVLFRFCSGSGSDFFGREVPLPFSIYYFGFFLAQFDAQFRKTTPPHTFGFGRVSSSMSPPTLTLIFI
jgi:hypothetical protein